MVYLILILLLSFLTFYYDYSGNIKGKNFWIGIIAFIFILIGTLHYRVGADTISYENFYNTLSPLNYLTEKEISSSRYAPGFIVLASFTKLFSPDLVLLNFIYSSFVCGVVIWFMQKHTKHIFFALLMFFLFCYTLLIFEQIREAIAVGVFLIAWQYFVKRKWIYWYALSFLAVMFHTSAMIMFILPIILLPGINQLFIFGKRTFLISVLVLLIAIILSTTFSKYIELLAVTQSMEDMTQGYANTHYVEGKLNIIGFAGHFIRNIFYPFIAMICLKDYHKNGEITKELKSIISFAIISIYISILSSGVPIIGRYNNYFFFFPIIVVSDWVFSYLKIGVRKIRLSFVYWVIFLLPMFAMQFYSYMGTIDRAGKYKGYMKYYPLTTFIDKEKDADKEKAIQISRKRFL